MPTETETMRKLGTELAEASFSGSIPQNNEPPRKKPKYVVRPAPIPPAPKHVETENGRHHPLDKYMWQRVFSWLSPTDLTRCLTVCKTWYRWALDSSLWPEINVVEMAQRAGKPPKITQNHLTGIVRRQSRKLDLSQTNISHEQLSWMVARLPHLKSLILSRCSWAAVSCLCSSSCPLLFELDLSWVSGVLTPCLRDLLAPPTDHRPGVDDSVSRLNRCTQLNLTGCDITDEAIEYVTMWLPNLQSLNISFCIQLTHKAIYTLAKCSKLQQLDISTCHNIKQVDTLASIKNLKRVRFSPDKQAELMDKFVNDHSPGYIIEQPGVLIAMKFKQEHM